MAGIYQEIWNADQGQNGVEAILDTEKGSKKNGYVKVNSGLNEGHDPDLKVLTDVHIPNHKMITYEKCRKLFNNYTLAEPMPEFDTPEEREEVHAFVTSILDTEPMKVARDYIARETGSTMTKERWHNLIVEMWFRRFKSGGDPELSGFEHIVVGEQEKSKVQGYHFWWKYYLDDGFGKKVDDGLKGTAHFAEDRISYVGSKMKKQQRQFPESVTISYGWNAPDYEKMAMRPLFKKIGGFFVGCSVEGLMALGTVRAHKGVRAPKVAAIEGARYDMKLYHSPNGQHIRTFYPIFLGPSDGSNGTDRPDDPNMDHNTHPIRIIAAMVNPKGDDVGLERVTLVNVSPKDLSLSKWSLRDKNGKAHAIGEYTIGSGEFYTIVLSGENVQLSNKGGNITLYDKKEKPVHRVSYSKTQAKNKGVTVLF